MVYSHENYRCVNKHSCFHPKSILIFFGPLPHIGLEELRLVSGTWLCVLMSNCRCSLYIYSTWFRSELLSDISQVWSCHCGL